MSRLTRDHLFEAARSVAMGTGFHCCGCDQQDCLEIYEPSATGGWCAVWCSTSVKLKEGDVVLRALVLGVLRDSGPEEK